VPVGEQSAFPRAIIPALRSISTPTSARRKPTWCSRAHAAGAADLAIVDALDKRIKDSRKTGDDGPDDDDDGTAGVLARTS